MPAFRTQIGTATQSKISGKWDIPSENWMSHNGKEYLASSATSAAVFDTEDEAYAGGQRALTCLEQTGKFPNMCEKF